jgi:rhodanese-related sulfurtransferase
VVVYCTGGECEDSHFAAELLREAGVPATNLAVYRGGIAEWEAARLPIETGPRGSGEIKPPLP